MLTESHSLTHSFNHSTIQLISIENILFPGTELKPGIKQTQLLMVGVMGTKQVVPRGAVHH